MKAELEGWNSQAGRVQLVGFPFLFIFQKPVHACPSCDFYQSYLAVLSELSIYLV